MRRSIGKTVAHYKILTKLGAGGMGVIYRAQDMRLGREVAIKFASEEFQVNPAVRECFCAEARTASAVNHPNLCAIYDIGEFVGRPFIVMELLEGQTRRKLIQVPLALELFLEIGIQITDALHALHTNGVVHLDVKPSNICVNSAGCAKILDFGVAQFCCADRQDSRFVYKRFLNSVSGTKRLLGSVPYMSPEQLLGKAPDPRSDLFSLGVTLYEMLTSERPYQGTTTAAVMDAITCKPITPISALRLGLFRNS